MFGIRQKRLTQRLALGVKDFASLNAEMSAYTSAYRQSINDMAIIDRHDHEALFAYNFFFIGRLTAFAESQRRDYLQRLAQDELNKIPPRLVQAWNQFNEYLNPDTGLLDFELPFHRALDKEIQESERARIAWDSRLAESVERRLGPEKMIQVRYLDYWSKPQQMTHTNFVTEADFDKWVEGHAMAEFDAYCQGHGDPTLSFMKIQVKRPGQDWEPFQV